MLAALNHPNICGIYGFEESDCVRFLILELVEGDTLAHVLGQEPSVHANSGGLPLGRVLDIARQITEALEVAHDKGIVHRDLKPANVNINADGVVKSSTSALRRLWVSRVRRPTCRTHRRKA